MLPTCKVCAAEIFWAHDPENGRWIPGDPESVSGDELVHEGDRGAYLLLAPHHRRHKCGPAKFFKRAGRSEDVGPPPPPPPRPKPPPRVVASASFGSFELMMAATTLFVLPNAPKEVIRAAHRALAAMHHPDRGGDVNEMIAINLAYDRLMEG